MIKMSIGSGGDDDDDYYDDDDHHGDDADHHFLVLPPHLILHLAGGVPQVVGLVRQGLALLHQDLYPLASLDDLVHILEGLPFQF